jgi:hypothetical protein
MNRPPPESSDPKIFTCLYCGVEFPKRKTGDHVIPQGFGKFTPELLLDNVCKTCDSNHGGKIEQAIMRSEQAILLRS